MDKIKQAIKYIMIFLGLVFLIIVFSVMLADEDSTKELPNPKNLHETTTRDEDDQLGIESKQAFMEGCLQRGTASEAYCGCVYDTLDESLTNDEFEFVIDDVVNNGARGNDIFMNAVEKCVPLFDRTQV